VTTTTDVRSLRPGGQVAGQRGARPDEHQRQYQHPPAALTGQSRQHPGRTLPPIAVAADGGAARGGGGESGWRVQPTETVVGFLCHVILP
jgi:hypothetical protein